MSVPPHIHAEVRRLLWAVRDGQFTSDDSTRLCSLLRDSDTRELYVSYSYLCGSLQWDHATRNDECPAAIDAVGSGRSLFNDPFPILNDKFVVSPVHPSSFIIHPSPPLLSPLSSLPSLGSILFSYVTAALILGVGILIAWMWKLPDAMQIAQQSLSLPSPPSSLPAVVGRVTGMVDCRWNDECRMMNDELRTHRTGIHPSSFIPHPSSPVSLGDTFALSSGLLEITYDTGAKVILQGPVAYEVESKDGGFLSLGKLTAKLEKRSAVSDQRSVPDIHHSSFIIHHSSPNPQSPIPNPSSLSTLHSPLFTITTPTAVVTDLGTEFGVEVSREGNTTSHVFRGLVRVQLAMADEKTDNSSQVLRENESARIEGSREARRIVVISSAKPVGFVREIPNRTIKTLDLVDVVAGGDGFSGRRNRGIDSTNGQLIGWAMSRLGRFPQGDGKYHRVEAIPFVDGVFVPDGRAGPVRLDSAGHEFDGFTNGCNLLARYIWAGGAIPRNDPTPSHEVQTQLGNVEYASPDHGYLLLTANNGITFDLEAIRRANPGCKLSRFRATAGCPHPDSSCVDLWVFVDGQDRFRRRQINFYNREFAIVIPIHEDERFLTLATTDGGIGIAGAEAIYGDPRLEMQSESDSALKPQDSQQGKPGGRQCVP